MPKEIYAGAVYTNKLHANNMSNLSTTVSSSKKLLGNIARALLPNRPLGAFVIFVLALFTLVASSRAESEHVESEHVELRMLEDKVLTFSLDHYREHFPDYVIEAEVTKLDSRTRLRLCSTPLFMEAPKILNRSGNSLISVRCQTDSPWRIYVPVKVSVMRDVLVASGPIARNSPVSASNTRIKRISTTSFRDDYISDLSTLADSIARRSLRDGQPITVNQLTTPTLVKRGDAVVISAKTGVTEVKISGIAQGAGKKGEQILVKNSHSKRTLRATITGRGRVSVLL